MTEFFSVWLSILNALVPNHTLRVWAASGDLLWEFDWGSWAMWLIWIGVLVWLLTLSTRLFVKLWRVRS